MGAITFSTLTGRNGRIRIPALGVEIGRLASWTLKRRGDDGPNEGSYDLHASLSYMNPVLFNHPEYSAKREVIVSLGGSNRYLLEEHGGGINLEGMSLTIEGVTLCRL